MRINREVTLGEITDHGDGAYRVNIRGKWGDTYMGNPHLNQKLIEKLRDSVAIMQIR